MGCRDNKREKRQRMRAAAAGFAILICGAQIKGRCAGFGPAEGECCLRFRFLN